MRRGKGEPCEGCGYLVCACLELLLLRDIRAVGLPDPVREFPFAHPRKYRADFAWPDARLLVEVEGGAYSQGRHTRGAGYTEDCRKYDLAVLLGWRVLRFTGEMVRDGTAVATIERALAPS